MSDGRPVNRRQARKVRVEFRDTSLLEGDPGCSVDDFSLPRLRRCPFDPTTIDWDRSSRVGGGLDGYVWKVWFGDSGPYALKVFWEATSTDCNNYFALQRECQNVAILQMIDAQMKRATTPILLNGNPKTKLDAFDNLYAFCDDHRDQPPAPDEEMIPAPPFPRMTKCYGWLEFDREQIQRIPRAKKAPMVRSGKIDRCIVRDKNYFAILYEYIEEGPNDPDVVEEVDRFLWLVGFCHTGNLARNWRRGILVDHSDIVYARSYGWFEARYRPRTAAALLRE